MEDFPLIEGLNCFFSPHSVLLQFVSRSINIAVKRSHALLFTDLHFPPLDQEKWSFVQKVNVIQSTQRSITFKSVRRNSFFQPYWDLRSFALWDFGICAYPSNCISMCVCVCVCTVSILILCPSLVLWFHLGFDVPLAPDRRQNHSGVNNK